MKRKRHCRTAASQARLKDEERAAARDAGAVRTVGGLDLVALIGLSASSVQRIISFLGTDMERFQSEKHFWANLGLARRNDVSAGKVLRWRTMKVVNRARQAFGQAAQSVWRWESELGAF